MQKSVLFMGLGYIGLPTAALVADAGLQVTGVDINENVVNNINNCAISNQEPGLQEIVEKNIRNGRLKASLTPSPSDVFLIVVPTPFNEHHQPDISYVTAATRQIIPYLKKGDLYILESTSPVGTTQKMAQLIFSERPELEDQIFIAYCPERILPGNALPIANIPVGTVIHNIEMHPGKGAQLVRSAGTAAQLMAKENGDAQIRMPSGEVRIIRTNCKACIGQVGNLEHENIQIGEAGRKRHMGWRPTVRGSVMNPCDHPHGGGEGKSPVGRPGPVTPWGKPALGYKTRKKKNPTDKFIVKRRNVK